MTDTTERPYRQGVPFSIAEARKLRDAGQSYRAIAEQLGTSAYLVTRVLETARVETEIDATADAALDAHLEAQYDEQNGDSE